MNVVTQPKWGRYLLWIIMAAPAVLMVLGVVNGRTEASDMLHPTGEFSARLMIIAMMIGPLADIFGQRGIIPWLLRHRRHIGVAAFAYAVIHTVFYFIDMDWSLADMLAELDAAGIWTGWIALMLMLLPALASNDAAMRMLRRNWKRVQQLAYGVALFTIAHWIFLSYDRVLGPALIHFAPLIILNIIRVVRKNSRRSIA
jgi:methionine sulfoxide reductase heme-binding subunit